ncbi:MAG: hypothetical protein HY880_07205, partial [Deltaproteobacteria bacterium]|nr:hypothetical protein [Deltaproteobacteria bacterium]
MSADRIDNRYILNELNRAVKTLQFYPKGHPNLDATLDKFYSIIKKRVVDEGEFRWNVEKDGFYVDDLIIAPPNWPVSELAKEFFARKVKVINFTHRITPGDIRSFLSILVFAPHELQEKGGVEEYLLQLGIAGILVNEMRFEDARKPTKELPDGEKAVFAETGGQGGTSLEELDLQERETGQEAEEETLEGLMSRLDDETDFLKYNDLAVRISEKAALLRTEGNYDAIFSVLKKFFMHTMPELRKPDIIAV